jgi:hypothetical protein
MAHSNQLSTLLSSGLWMIAINLLRALLETDHFGLRDRALWVTNFVLEFIAPIFEDNHNWTRRSKPHPGANAAKDPTEWYGSGRWLDRIVLKSNRFCLVHGLGGNGAGL